MPVRPKTNNRQSCSIYRGKRPSNTSPEAAVGSASDDSGPCHLFVVPDTFFLLFSDKRVGTGTHRTAGIIWDDGSPNLCAEVDEIHHRSCDPHFSGSS